MNETNELRITKIFHVKKTIKITHTKLIKLVNMY